MSGTPTSSGEFAFDIKLTDAHGSEVSASYNMEVGPQRGGDADPTLDPAGGPLAEGAVGVPYSATVVVNGNSTYTVALTGGSQLPSGLVVDGAGHITGTPLAEGEYGFYLVAKDTADVTKSVTGTYQIIVRRAPPVLSPTGALGSGKVGDAYSQQISASGGTTPYAFAFGDGTPPPGLTIDGDSGLLSGTPTAAGAYAFDIEVTDDDGRVVAASYSIEIAPADPVEIALVPASGSLPDATVGTPLSITFSTTRSGTYSFSADGTLPPGLTLGDDGSLSGTPTADGAFSFTVTAIDTTDATITASATYDLVVRPLAPEPELTGLDPTTGPVAGGQVVTLSGTLLDDIDVVTFGGAAAMIITTTSTSISLLTPAHPAGVVDVVISHGGFHDTLAAAYTYTDTSPSQNLAEMQQQATERAAMVSGRGFATGVEFAVGEGFAGGTSGFSSSTEGFAFAYAPVEATPSIAWPGTDDAAGGQQVVVWSKVTTTATGDWLDNWFGNDEDPGLTGLQVNAMVGASIALSSDVVVGVMGGAEVLHYRSADLDADLDGHGFTAGAYAGVRLGETGRLYGGLGYTGLDYDLDSGSATGAFAGHRVTATMGLTTSIDILGLAVEPSLSLFALWEGQDAYTDSLGTDQAARRFGTAEASAGVRVQYLMELDGYDLLPYAGLYADYSFAFDTADGDDADAGVSARAIGGLRLKTDAGTSFELGGTLGGLGSGSQNWSIDAGVRNAF